MQFGKKIIVIMDYKEKVIALLNSQELSKEQKEKLENIFPELQESEDEEVRLEIRNFIWEYPDKLPERDKWLAWFEKHNKQSYSNIPSRETIFAIWELGNDWKELTNGCISTEYGTQLDYIQKHWHESEYYLKEKQGKQTQLDYEHADIPQKDFAPIEPKFKVGDWVVNNVCFPMQIASIKDGMYVFTKGDAMSVLFIDGNFHLWTINDAKNGDVFVSGDVIFIFNKIHGVWVNCYCSLHKDGSFCEENYDLMHIKYAETIYPSTKEQRDTLFAKMKEAGYEWDADKKELKKIEPKTLDPDNVIAWLVANICDFEYYVKLFKKDFGLC